MPTYNKLIRDRIVEMIEEDGLHCNYRVLEGQEFLQEIKKKLFEEVKEYEQTATKEDAIDELADILELIHAALAIHNTSFNHLEEIRKKKCIERGGFEKRLYLIDVED